MFPKKERVTALLKESLKEMDLLSEIMAEVSEPDDFVKNSHGMILFRACGMSLQYITESMVKVRNLCGREFFNPYKEVPWDSVFGMRNFLSHEYGDVDAIGIFGTIKEGIPDLKKPLKQFCGILSPAARKAIF